MLLGTFHVYRTEVRPFSDKQIVLLQNFADQAVIAMENARLLTETREALEQQTVTAEVLQVINSTPGDLGPVFDAILDKGLHLCQAAFGTLWTFDGEYFHAVALRRVPAAFAAILTQAPYRPEPGSGHERILRGAPYAQDDDVAVEASIGPVRRALVELGGARTVIAIPLPRGRCPSSTRRIELGQAILVRGAAGSVGACAAQMAKEAGASVYGTARTRDIERVRALGAEPVVEGDRVGAQLASRPVDVVIDTIGDATRKHLRGVAPGRNHRLHHAPPRRGLCPVARRARGVFHRRRHPRPARQDLGDGPM